MQRKQDQPDTGSVPSGDRQLGHTMVLYPGHPLVGRIVTVVRRYGRRERGQWILELPDGRRQYVPISWCSPLSSEGSPPVPAASPDDPPLGGIHPSPLSLSGLRDLAAMVRRLQEEAALRGEEEDHAGRTAGEDDQRHQRPDGGRPPGDTAGDLAVAEMGELPRRGSTSPGGHYPPGGTPPGGGAADTSPSEEVRES